MNKVAVMLGVFVLISCASLEAGYWTYDVVDTLGQVGNFASLQIDAGGNPHVCYYQQDFSLRDLKYAWKAGGIWYIETVDTAGDVGHSASLALDANGNPHISYRNESNGDLKYARKAGDSWITEVIDAVNNCWNTSIAVDVNGNPHIVYYNASSSNVQYATKLGGSWSTEVIGAGSYAAITVDASFIPHVAYKTGLNDLAYAVRVGGSWTIDTAYVGSISNEMPIALDGNNSPHISFREEINDDLYYARKTGLLWSVDTVDTAGNLAYHNSMVLDAQGKPHIAYGDGDNYDLKYAVKDNGSWSIEIVEAAGTSGNHASIALDGNCVPHIAYMTLSGFNLKYATQAVRLTYPNGGESWVVGEPQTVRWEGEGEISIFISTNGGNSFSQIVSNISGGAYAITVPDVLTDAGCISISRQDPPFSMDVCDGCFSVQKDVGVKMFKDEIADATDDVGHSASLALDANGIPHICYRNSTNGDLKYARKAGRSWIAEVVDGTNDCWNSSIAVDINGNPHIVYYNASSGNVQYATKAGGSWSTEVIGGGSYAAITVDASFAPHVAYKTGSSDLAYAVKIGGSWTIDTVYVGLISNEMPIALDANSSPHISFREEINDDLYYAVREGLRWTIEAVDTAGDLAYYNSMVLDGYGKPHIAYSDDDNYDVKYAVKDNGSWITEIIESEATNGFHVSIAIDGSGVPHVAHMELSGFDLYYSVRKDGLWETMVIDTTGSMGNFASLVIDKNRNPHIAYYDQSNPNRDVKYATTALQILDPIGGETWDVGADETIYWSGPRNVDAYISLQGGDDWIRILNDVAGTAVGDSFHHTFRVPHFPTRFARIKLVYAGFAPDRAINNAASDSFFTITSTIAKLSFTAIREDNGILLEYETNPGPPDIAGYYLYRSTDEGVSYHRINDELITETEYRDGMQGSEVLFYQLGAVNNLGQEFIIGEATTAGFAPLLVYPNPFSSGRASIIYWVPAAQVPGVDKVDVSVRVYTASGRLVRELVREKKGSGYYTAGWDGLTRDGRKAPQGIYFIRMEAGDGYARTEKVQVIR